MREPLSLEHLQVLDAIDRQGSFAGAAASLHKVPSAITYAIQRLEAQLGVTIFRREGRRSVLTESGRVLLEQGRELLAAAGQLAETARQVERGWESRLTIAVDSLIEFGVVAEALQDFQRLGAETEIRLAEEVLAGAWESVLEDRADLVVGAPLLGPTPADMEVRRLMRVDFVFAVAPEHPLAQATEPLTVDQIRQYRAVVVPDTARIRAPMSRRLIASQPVLAVTDIEQKIQAQCRGLGVGYLPRHRIQQHLQSGALVLPPTADAAESNDLALAWKRGRNGKALQWFAKWFLAEVAEPSFP